MTSHDICRHPIGFLEFFNKPTEEELRIYYAERYFQTNQGNYRGVYSPEELAYIKNKLDQRAQMLSKVTRARVGTMLDVGCGEGFAMAHFQRLGWTVTGLDYSKAGVAAMNPHCLQMLMTGDVGNLLQQIGRSSQKFDLIWLSNVLEHVLDPVGLMKQMRELLNEDGVLVVIVPNDFSPVQRQLIQQGHILEEFWVTQPDHLSYFDASSLRALGAATGYRCQHLISDFPIDWFLYHPGSNYIADRSLGPDAHRARISLENLIAERPACQVNDFYEAMAELGLGRQLTAYFQCAKIDLYEYACFTRQSISYQDYTIRTVEPGDIECIREWRNAQMDVLRQKKEISPAEQLAYYEQHIWPNLGDLHTPNLLVAYLEGGRLIGYGGLVHISWEDRRAEVSFLLDPVRTSDSHRYEADFLAFLHLIKTLAFDDLKLHRLFTETYSNRRGHISVLEAADFSLEGVLRRHVIVDGQPVDSLIHGCLNEYLDR
jgi:2-polyprenyl-3-methyl-5-hydroxy-6-metoxy-1,4-benzoquinol methylase/RimJ/RimL family protein N-acetyltransferase